MSITKLVIGQKYKINSSIYIEEYKNAEFEFLGIDNSNLTLEDDEFDEDNSDCYWFLNPITNKREGWYLSNERENFDDLFIE